MKFLLPVLIASTLSAQTVSAGTVVSGPPLTAADLAKQLNIFATTFVYKQDKPFSSLFYKLSYKERQADGTYTVKTNLNSVGTHLQKPVMEMPIKVLVDTNSSNVILPSTSSLGKGESELNDGEWGWSSSPVLSAEGRCVLLTVYKKNSTITAEENIKGILEIELTIKD